MLQCKNPKMLGFWLPMSGFQNQHLTRSSKGCYNPDKRLEAESRYLPLNDYAKLSDRFKVKNMAMNLPRDKGYERNNRDLLHYGTDHWIIKNLFLNQELLGLLKIL